MTTVDQTAEQLPPVFLAEVATAFLRALESLRSRPLFVDDFARHLVDQTGMGCLDFESMSSRLYATITARTAYLDQVVAGAVAGGARQVVLLGAGLDSRAFRLSLPADATVYEVDKEPQAVFKAQLLASWTEQPTCRRVPVVAEPAGEIADALTSAGFDPDQPTVWLCEGPLMYLDGDRTATLLDRVETLSAPGSTFTGVHFGPGMIRESQSKNMNDRSEDMLDHQPWSHVDSPTSWLEPRGWTVRDQQSIKAFAETVDRTVPYDESAGAEVTWMWKATR